MRCMDCWAGLVRTLHMHTRIRSTSSVVPPALPLCLHRNNVQVPTWEEENGLDQEPKPFSDFFPSEDSMNPENDVFVSGAGAASSSCVC
jgi:hypothetical protein